MFIERDGFIKAVEFVLNFIFNNVVGSNHFKVLCIYVCTCMRTDEIDEARSEHVTERADEIDEARSEHVTERAACVRDHDSAYRARRRHTEEAR